MVGFVARWTWTLTIVVAVVVVGCADADDRSREIARVRAHLERVERELRASTPADLDATQAANRAEVIRKLRQYIDAEQYPANRISEEMTPIFIDGDGARCALAALLEASGHQALVQRIARTQNLAYVEELKDDPELKAWLTEHGVTLIEAARIQPEYANTTASRWQPTISVVASAHGEAAADTGASVGLAPGLRVGARRITESDGDCDHCVYSSLALVAEYSRSIVAGAGSTNQVAALVQYDLNDDARDSQVYVIGGPLASIDEDAEPGFGLGGQAGLGLGFRNRAFPLFAELNGSALGRAGGAVFRGGASFGFVW
jgi:hypothetical protein